MSIRRFLIISCVAAIVGGLLGGHNIDAYDDPYDTTTTTYEETEETWPDTTSTPTTTAPSSTSPVSTSTPTTSTSSPTTTSTPSSSAPPSQPPTTSPVVSVDTPPVPPTTCTGPQCPRLPTTGSASLAPWALLALALGGLLVYVTRRREVGQ